VYNNNRKNKKNQATVNRKSEKKISTKEHCFTRDACLQLRVLVRYVKHMPRVTTRNEQTSMNENTPRRFTLAKEGYPTTDIRVPIGIAQ